MIPFIDLKSQFKTLEKDIRARIDAVLEHGRYVMGPEIEELEKNLAEFAGTKHCLACSSGTDALLMPLMALGVGPGDAVFTTPFTFVATAEVIALLGATPIFVDIDPKTYNMDPAKLEEAILALKNNDPQAHPLPRSVDASSLTPKAIIPVDLFGLPADYEAINAIGKRHDLFVLEDTAQGFGGRYKGKMAGSLAEAAATSFFPAKPLGAYGDGGAVFTDSDEMLGILDSIRIHGQGTDKYDNVRLGLNARIDTIQAAVLLCKLAAFPGELKERQRVADTYTRYLDEAVVTPAIPEDCQSAWAQYSVLSDKRADIQKALNDAGIPTAVYYPVPLHRQTVYDYLGYRDGDLPVSEDIAARVFSLPMHPYLKESQIMEICEVIKSV